MDIRELVITFLEAESWQVAEQLVADNKEALLSADAIQALNIIASEADAHMRQILELHRDILRHARQAGIPAAFADLRAEEEKLLMQRTTDALIQFLNAEQPTIKRQLLEDHQALLFSNRVNRIFADLTQKYPKKKAELETNQAVLLRCQEIGITAAFQEIEHAIQFYRGQNLPPLN